MSDTSILRTALYFLGGALLLCLAGIIWLASANPARAIPDVLVATTGLVSGGLVGILVPTKSPLRRDEGGHMPLWLGVAGAVLLLLILLAVTGNLGR
jgi:hypothetical protein